MNISVPTRNNQNYGEIIIMISSCRAVASYAEIFPRGGRGANLGYGQKGGGAVEAYVIMRCYTLHLLGGGENDTRGVNAPSPPLNTALDL